MPVPVDVSSTHKLQYLYMVSAFHPPILSDFPISPSFHPSYPPVSSPTPPYPFPHHMHTKASLTAMTTHAKLTYGLSRSPTRAAFHMGDR
jgi:hypothetical protein